MKANKKLSLISLAVLLSGMLSFSLPLSAKADDTQFLAKPTGTYGVGFQDIHFQDSSRCPDKFYNLNTAHDFSPENTNHCREIMVRVYYPTNEAVSLGSHYYLPQISATEDQFKMIVQMEEPGKVLDFSELDALISYAHENASVLRTTEKFPVILYSPGDNAAVQSYENMITNLVSHGYVVVGINSLFVSGYNELPNGHVIKTSYAGDPQDIPARISDMLYIKHNLNLINKKLSGIMNEQTVGIMGHSQGANSVAQVAAMNRDGFKAAVIMDADVQPMFQSFSMPFLHELSGSRYWVVKYGPPAVRVPYLPKYELKKDNYLVGFVPDLDELLNSPQSDPRLWSTHGVFSDDSTLQYTSVYQVMVPLWEKLLKSLFGGNSPGNPYGVGYGFDTINSINTYNLQFFDTYLKGKKNPVFNTNNCQTLSPNTIISCGPTVFPHN